MLAGTAGTTAGSRQGAASQTLLEAAAKAADIGEKDRGGVGERTRGNHGGQGERRREALAAGIKREAVLLSSDGMAVALAPPPPCGED